MKASVLLSRRAGLIAGILVAGGVLLAMIGDDEPTRPVTGMRGTEENRAQASAGMEFPALPDQPPLARFAASLERPLFHPGRRPLPIRPPPEPTPVAEIPAPPPVGYRLRGAIITGEVRTAILEGTELAEHLRLGEGEKFKGWTLARIEPRSVTFKLRDQTFVLELALPEQGQ